MKFRPFLFTTLITLALLLFGGTAMAGDTGHYFNVDRSGEGLLLFRQGDIAQFGFFTYKDWQGCPGVTIPDNTLLTEDNCHLSRWFVSGGDPVLSDAVITGALYIGLGYGYPDGIPVFGDPFSVLVGDGFRVGTYTMDRFEGGWRMVVSRFGDILDEDDSLFDTIYTWVTPLIKGTD